MENNCSQNFKVENLTAITVLRILRDSRLVNGSAIRNKNGRDSRSVNPTWGWLRGDTRSLAMCGRSLSWPFLFGSLEGG